MERIRRSSLGSVSKKQYYLNVEKRKKSKSRSHDFTELGQEKKEALNLPTIKNDKKKKVHLSYYNW